MLEELHTALVQKCCICPCIAHTLPIHLQHGMVVMAMGNVWAPCGHFVDKSSYPTFLGQCIWVINGQAMYGHLFHFGSSVTWFSQSFISVEAVNEHQIGLDKKCAITVKAEQISICSIFHTLFWTLSPIITAHAPAHLWTSPLHSKTQAPRKPEHY